MTKRVVSYLLTLLLLAFFAAPLHAGEKVFINGYDYNFPPFAFRDERLNADGFDVKALDWIAKEMGFQVVHESAEWDCIIMALKKKEIDLIASGMTIDDKRKDIRFTVPYWTIRNVIIARKACSLTEQQFLMRGVRLAILRGTDVANWIEQNLVEKAGKKFTLLYYDSADAAVADLLSGKMAGIAMTDAKAREVMKKNPVKIVGTFGMPDEHFGYAVRKEDTALLEVLNEGLRKLMAAPYWLELQKKYLDQ